MTSEEKPQKAEEKTVTARLDREGYAMVNGKRRYVNSRLAGAEVRIKA